jgi:hypothetical protein
LVLGEQVLVEGSFSECVGRREVGWGGGGGLYTGQSSVRS